MHIPDGFLDAKTAVATGALAAAGLGVALRQARRHLPAQRVPLLGLAAAFVFAASVAWMERSLRSVIQVAPDHFHAAPSIRIQHNIATIQPSNSVNNQPALGEQFLPDTPAFSTTALSLPVGCIADQPRSAGSRGGTQPRVL